MWGGGAQKVAVRTKMLEYMPSSWTAISAQHISVPIYLLCGLIRGKAWDLTADGQTGIGGWGEASKGKCPNAGVDD